MDPRFTQAHKEAWYATILTIFYLIGWVICAYLPDTTTGITGFPLWFELSCIILPVTFTLLCWFMVKRFFKVIALDSQENDSAFKPIKKK